MGAPHKVMAVQDWPGILNNVLVVLREQVDESGVGVFSLSGVLKGTEFEKQTNTVSRYLQELQILTRGKKTSGGAYTWHLVTDRKVTLTDVRKVRKKNSKTSPKPKATQPKAKPLEEQLPDLSPWDSLPLVAQAAKQEFDALLAENAALKARLDEVVALVESFASAKS